MFFASDGIDVVISQVQLGYQSSFSPTISSVPLLPAAEWRELSEASHKDMHRDVLTRVLSQNKIIKEMHCHQNTRVQVIIKANLTLGVKLRKVQQGSVDSKILHKRRIAVKAEIVQGG